MPFDWSPPSCVVVGHGYSSDVASAVLVPESCCEAGAEYCYGSAAGDEVGWEDDNAGAAAMVDE